MPQLLDKWTLVFDLDGTLIDTAPDLLIALNHALRWGGYKTVADAVGRRCIGNGAKAMLQAGLAAQGVAVPEHELHDMWEVFLSYYVDHIVDHSRPFPDCEAVLDQLTAQGATLAVCTNKTQALAERVLSQLGLTERFAAVVGADSVPARKPDGDHIRRTVEASRGSMRHAIMIGDSQTDETAARNAGLPFVFVRFGYGPAPAECSGSIHYASDYRSVGDVIRRIVTSQTMPD